MSSHTIIAIWGLIMFSLVIVSGVYMFISSIRTQQYIRGKYHPAQKLQYEQLKEQLRQERRSKYNVQV